LGVAHRQWELKSGSVVENVLNLGVDAVTEMAPMPASRCQKLARLFGRLGLNAPLLDARHDHIGVE
jgi:hypothetical protein